jgi:phosphoribosylamine--glycine ligase
MARHGIPTAAFRIFEDSAHGIPLSDVRGGCVSLVVKADGLAAGKGVVIAQDAGSAVDTAAHAVGKRVRRRRAPDRRRGDAQGRETSFFVLRTA